MRFLNSTYHSQKAQPHLPGPDPSTSRSKAVDDQLCWKAGIEVALIYAAHVVVHQ